MQYKDNESDYKTRSVSANKQHEESQEDADYLTKGQTS